MQLIEQNSNTSTHRRWQGIDRLANSKYFSPTLVALCASVIMLLITWHQLGRSLWVDEAMLFCNYPVEKVSDILKPLKYYDQASSPAFSLLSSSLHPYNFFYIRLFLVAGITFSSSLLLLRGVPKSPLNLVLVVVILSFSTPMIMLSELKHYALEITGTIIAINWFIHKSNKENLNFIDLMTLTVSMVLGISTIITSSISVGLFFLNRVISRSKIKFSEVLYLLIYALLLILYYLLIKDITLFQISNYTDAYSSKGIVGNIIPLLGSTYSLVGAWPGVLILLIALALLLINHNNQKAKNLIILSVTTAIALLLITAIGMYPASNNRHLLWLSGFFWSILFFAALYGLKGNMTSVKLTYAFMALLLLVATKHTYSFQDRNYENTDNNAAILYLSNLPPSTVGLWIGGQPVLQAYSQITPALSKHKFIGFINPLSARLDVSPEALALMNSTDFHKTASDPGGWGCIGRLRIINDYSLPAEFMLSAAPKDKTFYIFASHYNIHAISGDSKARVDALHQALRDKKYKYEIIKTFNNVSIYRVNPF